MRPRKLSDGDLSEIKEMWVYGDQGEAMTLLDIAIIYDVSPPAIRWHVKHLEQQVKAKKGRSPAFNHARAIHLVVDCGMSCREVAPQFGVSFVSIARVVRKYREAQRAAST